MVRKVLHKNYILMIVAIAQFMVVLDVAIVNVALPSIYRELGFSSTSSLQWVVTAYTLAFGGFLLLGGRAADLYGRKKVFLRAVAVFGLMSLFCGLAQDPLILDITRALQGLAAAFMSPAALSIVITTFKDGAERNRALSIWGGVSAAGAAAGVLLGGILTEYLDWRWNFFVNVPVAIAVWLAAHHYVPESNAGLKHNKLDLPGAISVTSGLIAMVYALTQAPSVGWLTSQTLGFLAAAAALLGYFVWHESRSKYALVPLGIFKVGNVASANLAMFPIVAAMISLFFFISLYMQQVLGFSPIQTGLSFLPMPLVVGIMAGIMSKIVGKVGYKKPLVVGPLLVASALFYLSHISVGGSYWVDVLPGMILMAIGMGMVFISVTIAATAAVPHHSAGLASGLLNTSQQLGGAVGLAILSGVAASGVTAFIQSHPEFVNQPQSLAAQAQVSGFSDAMHVAMFFPLVTSIVALLFVKVYKFDEKDIISHAA